MFYIGEFSKMGRTTVKTLHYYDRIGLLQPQEVDESTGYRLYSTRQLVDLHRIQALKQAGLSIDDIQSVFAGVDVKPILEQRQAEIVRELHKHEEQRARIAFLLSEEEKEFFMDYQATVKEIPSQIVYSKRMTVPNYKAYFDVIPAIGRAVMQANPDLKCATPEYCYIVNLDGEYKESDINIEFNEAVEEFGTEVDGITFKKTEPLEVVSVMHKGGYDGLPQAYAFAMDWLEKSGYAIADFTRESYIDGIWNKDDEDEWLTEVQIPIVQ